MRDTPEKWRPSLSMVVVGMLIFILTLPITGIWLFRFYDNQLVRETEKELIVQAAFIEAYMIENLRASNLPLSKLGVQTQSVGVANKGTTARYLEPELDLATTTILPRRPPPSSEITIPDITFINLGRKLTPILQRSQKITLAGYRILDPSGTIIAGRTHVGHSLAHVREVKNALAGNYSSVIRERLSDSAPPPIYSISRGTGIRVFVAMPVIFENRVAGVVYLSRTPSHFLRELYSQKWKIGLAALFILTITFLIAYVFIRTIKGPIEALNERTNRIAEGDRTALEPLSHHGTRELASLSQGLMAMSRKLHDRSDYLKTFATHVSHELKSPLTSIQGATELLRDSNDQMNEKERKRFIENILGDTERLTKLLDRLRALAIADNSDQYGRCNVAEEVNRLRSRFRDLEISLVDNANCDVGISPENAEIIFGNLFENAQQHFATSIKIEIIRLADLVRIRISDNGDGISELNQAKIFDLFFTTRREHGGTGMGLGIIHSILHSNNGQIRYKRIEKGACFEIDIPAAEA